MAAMGRVHPVTTNCSWARLFEGQLCGSHLGKLSVVCRPIAGTRDFGFIATKQTVVLPL